MRLAALALAAVVSATALAASPNQQEQQATGGHLVGDRAAAAAVGIEWGGSEASIRPGAPIDQIVGFSDDVYQANCTLNWVFFDEVTGDAYVGTAAHCVEKDDIVEHGRTGPIGSVVFDSDDDMTDERLLAVDFALIRIDDERIVDADPEMLTWGGPHGYIQPDELSIGDLLVLHGSGAALGVTPATRGNRGGGIIRWTDDEYVADLAAVNGDSGSSLLHLDTGFALGIISRYGFTDASTDVGPMLPFIFEALGAGGFENVVLAIVD